MANAEPFERCPVCGDTVAVRLDLAWLETAGPDVPAIPIIGCGAPWHYINRAAKPAQAARDRARLENLEHAADLLLDRFPPAIEGSEPFLPERFAAIEELRRVRHG